MLAELLKDPFTKQAFADCLVSGAITTENFDPDKPLTAEAQPEAVIHLTLPGLKAMEAREGELRRKAN